MLHDHPRRDRIGTVVQLDLDDVVPRRPWRVEALLRSILQAVGVTSYSQIEFNPEIDDLCRALRRSLRGVSKLFGRTVASLERAASSDAPAAGSFQAHGPSRGR